MFPAAPGSRARVSAALRTDHLAVARTANGVGLLSMIRNIATLQFLWITLVLAVLLLIVWAFERRALVGDRSLLPTSVRHWLRWTRSGSTGWPAVRTS